MLFAVNLCPDTDPSVLVGGCIFNDTTTIFLLLVIEPTQHASFMASISLSDS